LTLISLIVRIALLGLAVFGAVILVLYGTSVRNKWGINFKTARCPHCEASAPRMRMPKSLREFMWGGWTCDACGTRVDKWGQELGAGPPRTGLV
jgi:hypothetical protein